MSKEHFQLQVLNLHVTFHLSQPKRKYEPQLDNTNKMACAPSEDTDQPGHPPSLIRVFAVRMKKHWVLRYPLSTSEDSDQTGRTTR